MAVAVQMAVKTSISMDMWRPGKTIPMTQPMTSTTMIKYWMFSGALDGVTDVLLDSDNDGLFDSEEGLLP